MGCGRHHTHKSHFQNGDCIPRSLDIRFLFHEGYGSVSHPKAPSIPLLICLLDNYLEFSFFNFIKIKTVGFFLCADIYFIVIKCTLRTIVPSFSKTLKHRYYSILRNSPLPFWTICIRSSIERLVFAYSEGTTTTLKIWFVASLTSMF